MSPDVLQVAGWTAAVAVPFFVVAMGVRLLRWLRVPRSGVRLGLFPERRRRWLGLGKDSFLFPQIRDVDRRMWATVIVFHGALLLLFVGHLRLLFEFTLLARAFGERGWDQVTFVAGGLVGVVLVLAALYFLARRLVPPGRQLSVPQDYFLLALFQLVVLSGCNLRFLGDVPVGVYRQYVVGILVLDPQVPAGLDAAAARWSLAAHVLLASALFFYFPVSRLMHVVGSLAANLIRGERFEAGHGHG